MSDQRFTFNKFMDKFLQDDEKKLKNRNDFGVENEKSPFRRYNRLYQELWQNRIRWRNE